MKKQIVLIHGATAFSNYNAFLEYLKVKSIEDPLRLEQRKRWKDGFKEEMSREGYEVYFPSMPNSDNAKYEEWKIWFERYFEYLHDGVILIGHSQGGYFLAKYLSENKIPISVKALYLLSAPFEPADFGEEDGGDFNFDPKELKNLEKQVDSIFLFHSKDDPVVPYEHVLKFKKALPEAELITFEDKGHFLMEEFHELTEHIRGL